MFLKVAEQMHVPPWELRRQSVRWYSQGAAVMGVEADVAAEKRRNEGARQRQIALEDRAREFSKSLHGR